MEDQPQNPAASPATSQGDEVTASSTGGEHREQLPAAAQNEPAVPAAPDERTAGGVGGEPPSLAAGEPYPPFPDHLDIPGDPAPPSLPPDGTLEDQGDWSFGYPASPSVSPDAPTVASYVLYPPLPPTEPLPPAKPSRLALPFPRWLSATVFATALALVAVVYVAAEAAHADWAGGLSAAGITALALAMITLTIGLTRVALGRRETSAVILLVAMVTTLATTGAGGLLFAPSLHGIQARQLEQSQQWAYAIREYTLAGDTGPRAQNLARVYVEWGEQLLRQRHYAQAVTRFSTVASRYADTGAWVTRANTDLYQAYRAWVQANTSDVQYNDAINDFIAYRGNLHCDTACKNETRAIEAQARYQFGLWLTRQARYTAAIGQLEIVQAQFKGSPFVARAHAAAAAAYYAYGRLQLTSSACTDAVPTFTTLATKYGDTPEGRKAKAALAAPQTVKGQIVNFPHNPVPSLLLSRYADPNRFLFSSDYTAKLDATSGAFTFTNVAQGNYNIATLRITGGTEEETWYADRSNGNLYTVHVGPLCPVSFGTYTYKQVS